MVYIYKDLEEHSDVCIVDENRLPVCFFLDGHLKESFSLKAFNTKLSYARVLSFVYNYFESQSIDLVGRSKTGEFLSYNEYEDFKRHCFYKSEGLTHSNNIISFSKFSDKQLDNLLNSKQYSDNRVSAFTAKNRLSSFVQYLDYLYKIFHFGNFSPINVYQAITDLKAMVSSDIKKMKSTNTDVRDPFEQAIPDSIYFKMLEIIKPYSIGNPWKNSRLRNQLIINIFIETGMREGALAKLKVRDIKFDWHSPRLMVTRTPNDATDSRYKPPAQKTKSHSSGITKNTLNLLKLYIETEREKYVKSSKHDFIFVAEKGVTKGMPISLNSIYRLTNVLAIALDFKLTPHLFRHKWNEVFDNKAIEAGYTAAQIEDIRKYAMGWSEGSQMAERYNDFKCAMKAHELSQVRQSEFMPKEDE